VIVKYVILCKPSLNRRVEARLEFSVGKKVATGSFNYNPKRKKTLPTLIKLTEKF